MLADAIFAENELLANKHRHDAACRSAVAGSILPVFAEQLYDIIIGTETTLHSSDRPCYKNIQNTRRVG